MSTRSLSVTQLLTMNSPLPTELNILAQSEDKLLNLQACSVEFEAAPSDGNESTLRRFTMTAYTGGPMQLSGWRYPVVVDLQGMQMGKQRRPILLDHTRDVDFVVGQTDSIAVMNNTLIVAGQVMGDSPQGSASHFAQRQGVCLASVHWRKSRPSGIRGRR